MTWVVAWIIFAIVVAVAAISRGRNGFGWFVLACLISPLLAYLLLVAMPVREIVGPISIDQPSADSWTNRVRAQFSNDRNQIFVVVSVIVFLLVIYANTK
jgi:uncharacterized membrane protein YhdT